MKRKSCVLMLLMVTALGTSGCSSLITGVPDGSVLMGVYAGSFNGSFNSGDVTVKVYQEPSGAKAAVGQFECDAAYAHWQGELQGSALNATILLPWGGWVKGELSPDGRLLTGTFWFDSVPHDHGSWDAKKK